MEFAGLEAGNVVVLPQGRLRARLKQETTAAHARIEDHPRLAALARGAVSEAEYRQILLLKLAFWRPVERAIAGAADWATLGAPLAGHEGAPRLVADLQDLGCTASELAALPDCAEIPQIQTVWQAVGCRYVLAGASLGGKVIARALDKTCRSFPLRFYTSGGESIGRAWKSFCNTLDSLRPTEREEGTIIGAACDTFARLHEHLERSQSRHCDHKARSHLPC